MAIVTAVQVLTGSSIAILTPAAGDNRQSRGPILISNLGPNAIFVGTSNAVTTATGFPIPATTGSVNIGFINSGDTLYARAATADQTTPADTRVMVGR